MAGLRSSRRVQIQQGDQRTRLPALACRAPARSSSNFGAGTAQEVGGDALRQVHTERRAARELTGDSVSSGVLAHGPGLLRPWVARVLDSEGCRGRALVTVGYIERTSPEDRF